jgi:hypothetical protein
VNYQDTIKEKRDVVAQAVQERRKQQELAGVVVQAITDKGIKVTAEIDTSKTNEEQVAALKSLQTAVEQLQQSGTSESSENVKLLADVLTAIKSLELAPTINLPALKPPKLDLTPLHNMLQNYLKPEDTGIDLDCYKAQDIRDDDNKQYVGFLNLQGDWYIIENDIKANSMRYVFGSGNYAKAFTKAGNYEYKLLNEAVNATA